MNSSKSLEELLDELEIQVKSFEEPEVLDISLINADLNAFDLDIDAFNLNESEIALEEERIIGKGAKLRNLIFDILVYGLALMLIAVSTMFAFSNDTGKSLFGYRFYNVLSPSMRPVFDAGDMIFIELCEPEEVKEGDIITFLPNVYFDVYLTHRVIEVEPATEKLPIYFITQGDANDAEDAPVSSEALVGKYLFRIPKAGTVIAFIRENLIVMGVLIVASFALLIVLRSYFSTKKEMKEQELEYE